MASAHARVTPLPPAPPRARPPRAATPALDRAARATLAAAASPATAGAQDVPLPPPDAWPDALKRFLAAYLRRHGVPWERYAAPWRDRATGVVADEAARCLLRAVAFERAGFRGSLTLDGAWAVCLGALPSAQVPADGP